MATLYRLKEGADLNKFAELGYDITNDGNVIFTIVKQPIDGEAANYLRKNFYDNPKWREKFYNENKEVFKEKIGLEYDDNGEIIMTEKIEKVLTEWFLLVDITDTLDNGSILVGFGNKDPFDKHIFYGAGLIKKFCSEEVQKLLDNDLIEEYEELPVA